MGKLVATASDGSVMYVQGVGVYSLFHEPYVVTDRHVYRQGDTVHYHVIARKALPHNLYLGLVGPNNYIMPPQPLKPNGATLDGEIHLPADASSGSYFFAAGGTASFYVANTNDLRYSLDIRALNVRLRSGEPLRCVISARLADGRPGNGIAIRYEAHVGPYSWQPLMEQRFKAPAQVTSGIATTNADGDAFISVPTPARVSSDTSIEVFVFDPGGAAPIVSTRVNIEPAASANNVTAERDRSVKIYAAGNSDGDALVRYGAYDALQWKVVPVVNRHAEIDVVPPTEQDEFNVSMLLPSHSALKTTDTAVHIVPQQYRLRIAVRCAQAAYTRAKPVHLCISIRDRKGRPIAAWLTLSLTFATLADIAGTQASNDRLYSTLYDVNAPIGQTVWSPATWNGTPPVAYLDRPAPLQRRLAAVSVFWNRSPRGGPSEQVQPPQTLHLLQRKAPRGELDLNLAWPRTAVPGEYLLHVTAVSARHAAGETYAWFRLSAVSRP